MPDGSLIGALPRGGVRRRWPRRLPGLVVERYGIELPASAERRVLALAEEQIGKPYDWLALAGLVMHRDWRCDDMWFCSEMVEWLFEDPGYPLLRTEHLDLVTPRDLRTSLLLNPLTASAGGGRGAGAPRTARENLA